MIILNTFCTQFNICIKISLNNRKCASVQVFRISISTFRFLIYWFMYQNKYTTINTNFIEINLSRSGFLFLQRKCLKYIFFAVYCCLHNILSAREFTGWNSLTVLCSSSNTRNTSNCKYTKYGWHFSKHEAKISL